MARCLQGGGLAVHGGTVTITSSSITRDTANVRAHINMKVPIAPMGKLLTCWPRLTLAQLRMLWSTTGGECSRDLQKFPSPDADMLAPTHACTTANALVNDRGYVPQGPCKVSIALMGKLLTCWPRLTLAKLRIILSTTE